MSYSIRVFISSKQAEFSVERAVLSNEIKHIPVLEPVLAEDWNPTGSNVHDVYLNDVHTSPIYVGLFGSVYSEPTHLEYLAALDNPYREKLIYVKKSEQVDERLKELLVDLNHMHVPFRFTTIADLVPAFSKHLMAALSRMILHLQQLGEAKPVMHGAGGPMEKRWLQQQKQIRGLGLPLSNSPGASGELISQINDAMSRLKADIPE